VASGRSLSQTACVPERSPTTVLKTQERTSTVAPPSQREKAQFCAALAARGAAKRA
jgi:hypothetical protein